MRFRTALLILTATCLYAQAPAGGLVVGSGNFFSPIVADLDRAIAFYRDGLGLQVTGEPSNADNNPALRAMFGLPEARLRWTVARPPGMRTGVEIVEIKNAGGKPVDRQIQDPGSFTLVVQLRDRGATLTRLKALGAPVVSTSDAAVVVRDPDGHFVSLVQAEQPGVRVRLTVQDAGQVMRLYCDTLGLMRRPETNTAEVPGSGLVIEFAEYKKIERRAITGRIQDPGSTRMQLQVRNVEAAIAAITKAGGTVVSSGGGTVALPAGRGGTTTTSIVRDPNNLFVVLIGVP
jgi:catechol 2,3-dioxygenase-like lactoylglutathione lyase family enzyme